METKCLKRLFVYLAVLFVYLAAIKLRIIYLFDQIRYGLFF